MTQHSNHTEHLAQNEILDPIVKHLQGMPNLACAYVLLDDKNATAKTQDAAAFQ